MWSNTKTLIQHFLAFSNHLKLMQIDCWVRCWYFLPEWMLHIINVCDGWSIWKKKWDIQVTHLKGKMRCTYIFCPEWFLNWLFRLAIFIQHHLNIIDGWKGPAYTLAFVSSLLLQACARMQKSCPISTS